MPYEKSVQLCDIHACATHKATASRLCDILVPLVWWSIPRIRKILYEVVQILLQGWPLTIKPDVQKHTCILWHTDKITLQQTSPQKKRRGKLSPAVGICTLTFHAHPVVMCALNPATLTHLGPVSPTSFWQNSSEKWLQLRCNKW